MFKGSIVALVTPFSRKGGVDEAALKRLVEFHVKNGTDGIVPCGTTGESATLNYEEHERVIEICVKVSKKRIPVIAGTGSNSTQEAIDMSLFAKRVGADGLLLVSPYYNKPTQKGLYLHFKAVADSVGLPVVLYNIASRTGVNIEPETVCRLSQDCNNIVGIKEASGSLEQMSRIIALCGKKLTMLSGDDSLTLPLMAIGGEGIISVVANIIPKDVKALVSAFKRGDIAQARRLHYKMLPLIKAMFIETNPIPVKTAMGQMKLCEPSLRLPMCEMMPENLAKLKKALKEYGLI
ncbi:MAG TPA: 4-hydroxy-tetrahydrodipicolinate synthase [Candidatus Omnitrophica bacterium]|nr:4-hydroxy-tetrahydrodipicolinate synthase [Candidatus Omnitrophota bacterium]